MAHPQRDALLKGTGASGAGASQGQGGQGGSGGKRTMTRSQFDALSDPAAKATAAREATIVDG